MKVFSSPGRYLGLLAVCFLFPALFPALVAQQSTSPFYDFPAEKPGTIHKFAISDLPEPAASKSAVNPPDQVERPAGAMPKTLPGFAVNLYADGFQNPRELRTAPNGDVFVAEMEKGEIKVLRGITKDGKAEQVSTFATGLNQPFGIAFYPPGPNPEWVYIGETGAVKKFAYKNGDLKASGSPPTEVAEIFPRAESRRSHATRQGVFFP